MGDHFLISWGRRGRVGGGGLGVGLLRISSDGGDRMIFLGLKFAIPGFFGVGKFCKYFLGDLI